MKSFAKAEALLRDVADKLAKRYAGSTTIDTVRSARDSAGWPMLFLSDGGVETAGNPVIAIRIKGVDAVSKDVFGGDTTAYTPHTLEVAYEADGIGFEPSQAEIWIAAFEAIKTGVRAQLKVIADGTAVTAANMDAASASADLEELYWPTKGV